VHARQLPILPVIAWALALLGCFEPPEVDLIGPTVIAASLPGPRSVELSVTPELVVEFSEAIDPASIHAGSVALIPWDELSSCARTPVCPKGSCERGTCQEWPLTVTKRAAIDRGSFAGDEGVALIYELGEGAAGPDTRLHIRPRRPLAGHRRHRLIVGAAVRDRSGAPLVDDYGQIAGWQRDFVTAGRGSGGPEPRLVAPAPGQHAVPTNVARIDTEFWPPIPIPSAAATLLLEPEQAGAVVELIDPQACPGWVPGTCLRWRPAHELEPDHRYRLAGGSLVDRHGRPALLPAEQHETWFALGSGPDLQAPQPRVTAQMRGRCLGLWVEVGESVAAVVRVGQAEGQAIIHRAGWIGLAVTEELEPTHALAWSLELTDLADNHAVVEGQLEAGASFDPALPRLDLTEILANPLASGNHAEFVELRAGPAGAELAGVYISDLSPADIREAWFNGKLIGDALPAVALEPNEVAVVVPAGYATHVGEDPRPPPSTRLLVVGASIGVSGLKNVGEPVTLWKQTDHGPTAISTYSNTIKTDAKAHKGRSVVAGHDGCDLPDRWRSHPFGRSTPGSLP